MLWCNWKTDTLLMQLYFKEPGTPGWLGTANKAHDQPYYCTIGGMLSHYTKSQWNLLLNILLQHILAANVKLSIKHKAIHKAAKNKINKMATYKTHMKTAFYSLRKVKLLMCKLYSENAIVSFTVFVLNSLGKRTSKKHVTHSIYLEWRFV